MSLPLPQSFPQVATPPRYEPSVSVAMFDKLLRGHWSRVDGASVETVYGGDRRPLGVGGNRYPCSSDVSGSGDTPRWVCSAYFYPDGTVDGSVTPVPREPGKGARRSEQHRRYRDERRFGREVAQARAEERLSVSDAMRARLNAERAIQRSKVSVRRRVRAHGLKRLLTFTNGSPCGGWQSRKDALDDVSRFLKVHGPELFAAPMVLVAERGGALGRWHVHAATTKRRIDYSRVISCWSSFLTNRGWVSSVASGVHRFHAGDEHGKHKGGFASARTLARYLVKYLSKSMAVDPGTSGEHRYRSYRASLPVAWRAYAQSLAPFGTLLGLMWEDVHPCFSVVTDYLGSVQCEHFRCWVFDTDGLVRPPTLPDGSILWEIDPA